MRKKLHPAVLTIAICQVVFGVLALACDGFGVINASALFMTDGTASPKSLPPNSAKAQPTTSEAFERGFVAGMEAQTILINKAPGYTYLQVGQSLVGLLFAFLMIASGIGLFFMHSWARWLAIGYAVLSLLGRCTCVGYHAVIVVPLLSELGDRFIKEGNPDLNSNLSGLKYGPFGGLLLGLYPLLVLILLLLPAVSRAFHAQPVDSPPDDFRDRNDLRERDDYRDPYPGERDDRFGSR